MVSEVKPRAPGPGWGGKDEAAEPTLDRSPGSAFVTVEEQEGRALKGSFQEIEEEVRGGEERSDDTSVRVTKRRELL